MQLELSATVAVDGAFWRWFDESDGVLGQDLLLLELESDPKAANH